MNAKWRKRCPSGSRLRRNGVVALSGTVPADRQHRRTAGQDGRKINPEMIGIAWLASVDSLCVEDSV